MILVIVNKERNRQTGRVEMLASHGVDIETGKMVTLPPDPPDRLGAVFDSGIGEYVLRDVAIASIDH